MKQLEQTWRWYGPDDLVGLSDARQAGATGIVSSLHHVANGAVWEKDEILFRKKEIERAGLRWSVVESVPIHEDIKRRTGSYELYIDNYKKTIRHLAECDVRTVAYNFMPVMDWVRTDLSFQLPDGALALYFNRTAFAAFDLYILKRPNTISNYNDEERELAKEYFEALTDKDIHDLTLNIIAGLPGGTTEGASDLDAFRILLASYDSITADVLQRNLVSFLNDVVPTAEKVGVSLAIHPDDPPFPLLGLPRVMSTLEHARHILEAVPSPANGLCFCTGSYGARKENNLVSMIRELGDHIRFIHLRSTKSDALGNFYEASHLNGDVDMYEVMRELLIAQQKVASPIPMRPDHGHQILDDLVKTKQNPGYTAIGRLKGLAELRGLQEGIIRSGVI